MAATKETQDKDVIARLADKGEETLRRLVDTPRRLVGGVDARFHDLASKLRAIDPLDSRVAALERRLESLEKPAKKTTRRTTRPKAAATRQVGTGAAAKPDDAEKDDAPAVGENEPTP
jgi:DNA-binding PadR family transcriptional regulator